MSRPHYRPRERQQMAISTPQREPRHWSRSEPPRPTVFIAETSLLLTVLVVVMVLIAAVVVIGNIGPNYQATIEEITPSGSSQVIVEFQVVNVGGSPATPTCEIDMSSSASAFTGQGTFKPNHSIPGRSSAEYSVLIPVTTDGATRVNFNSSSVGCK